LEKAVTSPTYDPTGSSSTVETAKSEAANVKDTAAKAAAGVKEVAIGEVSNVADEARYQTRNLLDQTRSELRGQASNQQSALAAMVKAWASEIGAMATRSQESGPMTDLAYKASRRGGEIANWLDTHEPGDLLEEVKRFARRRPVAFLALAAAAGVVVGRLTRGAVASTSVDSKTEPRPARAYDGDIYRGDYESVVPSGAGAADPEQPHATGTAYPNITPTTDESHYPPPVEGEVRR
jgi:hypothetical protein